MPRPGPSLCVVLMAADSNVCANFQEFLTMLSPPPPNSQIVKKIYIDPNEINRALRLSGLGPNNKDNKD